MLMEFAAVKDSSNVVETSPRTRKNLNAHMMELIFEDGQIAYEPMQMEAFSHQTTEVDWDMDMTINVLEAFQTETEGTSTFTRPQRVWMDDNTWGKMPQPDRRSWLSITEASKKNIINYASERKENPSFRKDGPGGTKPGGYKPNPRRANAHEIEEKDQEPPPVEREARTHQLRSRVPKLGPPTKSTPTKSTKKTHVPTGDLLHMATHETGADSGNIAMVLSQQSRTNRHVQFMERSECTPYGDDTIQYEINAHQWNIGDEEDDATYTDPAPLPTLVGEPEGVEIPDFFANEPRPQPDDDLSIDAIQDLIDEEDARKNTLSEAYFLSEDFRDQIDEQDNLLFGCTADTDHQDDPDDGNPSGSTFAWWNTVVGELVAAEKGTGQENHTPETADNKETGLEGHTAPPTQNWDWSELKHAEETAGNKETCIEGHTPEAVPPTQIWDWSELKLAESGNRTLAETGNQPLEQDDSDPSSNSELGQTHLTFASPPNPTKGKPPFPLTAEQDEEHQPVNLQKLPFLLTAEQD